ncbi:HDOD domain-containing protein [Pelobacter seleniigenes]|uniref:HDOD domain-containing protein n=1 Tax=Pelobacter seleniigenes TaxID=407188 RepID=UPI0004A6B206|nr:HDOD domain-containing protein [Pelobacter seleniigenes]
MHHIYLKNKSYSVENLPSEPSLLVELLNLCHNENANFEMFSTAIGKDVALTAKILQVANSPAYRQWNEITDIRRMLIVLGLVNVKNIVVTCAIQQFFSRFSKEFSTNVKYIWLRSLLCANLAHRIAKLVGYEKPGEAFLAGLLHQIGMLLLLLNRENDYLPLLNSYYEDTPNFVAHERATLQMDHCELGAALIESWRLDSFIADAVQFQQAPLEELVNAPILLRILAAAGPLSSRNSARSERTILERAGILFDLTENSIQDCLGASVELSKQMIADLGFSSRFYMEDQEQSFFEEESPPRTHQQLARQIKNFALASTISRSEKQQFIDFTKEIRVGFSTLFNLSAVHFFRADDQQLKLIPINDLKIKQLEEMEFSLADQRSLLVKAFQTRQEILAAGAGGSIGDKQMIRLLGSDSAYFLPLYRAEVSAGVIAIGCNQSDITTIQQRADLLRLLSREIAGKYFIIREASSVGAGMPLIDFRKVAHEVSNPLTIINNYLYVLGKKIDAEHPAQEELRYISEEIERAANILLRAKDPQAEGQAREDRTDVNKLIVELDKLFKNSIFKTNRIESSLKLDGQIPILYCSKDKLKQILINIIKNAVEAMPEGGRLDVESRDNYYQNKRPHVEISIRDNGPGIAPEVLKNLFKPVTSTKTGHSGLGLAIVNSLVEELDGTISCYSRHEKGTEFKILIPRVTEKSELETE